MDKNNPVQDNEELYRSVRGELEAKEYSFDRGKLIIHPAAFRDRHRKPSVDRGKLRDFNPTLSLLNETDGIASLMTADVRAIGKVKTKIQDADAIVHAVDIIHDPTPQNPAHSQITVNPEFFGSKNKQRNVFKLLQIALATLATKNGWTLEPSIR